MVQRKNDGSNRLPAQRFAMFKPFQEVFFGSDYRKLVGFRRLSSITPTCRGLRILRKRHFFKPDIVERQNSQQCEHGKGEWEKKGRSARFANRLN
jgi:hypothetical protein